MATAGQLGNQLGDLTEQYTNIGTFDPGKTRKTFLDKVKSFQPQFEEKARIDQQAYAAPADMMQGYYNEFGDVPGTGPSGMARLSSILNNIGNLYGRSDTLGGIIDMQGGRIDNIVGEIGDQAKQEQQNIMNAFNMIMPRYQQANARISEIENRELQEQQMLQNADQFAQQMGLSREQFLEGVRQFNEQMEFNRANAGRGGGGGGLGDYIDLLNYAINGDQGDVNGESTQDPYADLVVETGIPENAQGLFGNVGQNIDQSEPIDYLNALKTGFNQVGQGYGIAGRGIGNFIRNGLNNWQGVGGNLFKKY